MPSTRPRRTVPYARRSMADRVRAALVTLRTAPWRRAPRLLWGHWGVVLTVAGACAVVAAAAAAVPLYLSSVGSAAVSLQVDERCPRDTGVTQSFQLTSSAVLDDTRADPFVSLRDQLQPASRWARVEGMTLLGSDPAEDTDATLLMRDGAADHVEVLDGPVGAGAWITDRAAERTGLQPGDTASLNGIEVPVAAVYRDVAGTTVDDYWCSNGDLLLLEVRGGDLVLPPPVVLVDEADFSSIVEQLEEVEVSGAWEAPAARLTAWEAPLAEDLTLADLTGLVPTLACRTPTSAALGWCEDGERPPVGTRRNRDFTTDEIRADDDADFVERYLHSHLPFVIRRAEAIQTSVGGGVWPVAGFAALAGIGLVAASASLWFDRRRREVTLLTVRGVSPAGLGLKAALELAAPALVGCAAGIALAYGMVAWLGPSPAIEPGALGEAALAGGVAFLAAAATTWLVVLVRIRSRDGRRPRRLPLGAVPWELALAWATMVSYRRLGDWGVPVGRGANVSRVDVWGLLFPVLFLVTAVAMLSRLLGLTVRPLRAGSRAWPTSLYLAVRRVARYRVAVLGLVAASALAAGVLGYAATMNRSLDATLETKATTFVGSDVAARVADDVTVPPSLDDRATLVHIHQDAWIDVGGHEEIAVIALDPATFDRAAHWDATFSGESLGEILEALAAPPLGERVPGVVVGIDAADVSDVGIEEIGTTRFQVEQVAAVDAFPGMRKPEPTVFVSSDALAALDIGPGATEVWIRGERESAVRVFEESGTAFHEDRRRDDVADGAAFVTVTWTFGFMQSLGISAGLLGLGGVAVYLDARRRDRLLGYAFMRRMGLRGSQHRRALLVELGASVVVGCWVGLALAVAAAWFAHGRVDPVPTFEPEPLLRPALAVVLGLAAASVVITVAAAAFAQRRVDRDDPVEVLRAGL